MKKILFTVLMFLISCSLFATGTLTIAKSSWTAHPVAGANYTYVIAVTCTGNCFNVQVTDTLPTGLAFRGSSPAMTITNGVGSWYGGNGAYSMTNSSQNFTFWGNMPVYSIYGITNTAEGFGTQGGDASSTTILAMATPTFTFTITKTNTPVCSPTFTQTRTTTPATPGLTQTAIWQTQTVVISNAQATRTVVAANIKSTATAAAVIAASTKAAATAAVTANATQTIWVTQTYVAQLTATTTALHAQQTKTATALALHETQTVLVTNIRSTRTAIAEAAALTATQVAYTVSTAQVTKTMIVNATQTAIAQKTANYYLTASATFTSTRTLTLTVTLTPTATHNPSTPWSVGGTTAKVIYPKPAYLVGVYVMQWMNTSAGSGMIGVYNATSPTGCVAANYVTSITSTAQITGTTYFDEASAYFSNGITLSNTACDATVLPKYNKATQ